MITKEFKEKVRDAILEHRKNFPDSPDASFAKMIGINPSSYNRLKKGEIEKIASENFWIENGRKLGVTTYKKVLKLARTEVYNQVEEIINFCKNYQKATIIIDECEIGKTRCSKHVIKNMINAFRIDCSQASSKTQFIRLMAKTLGLDNNGRLHELKENIKYYINQMDSPIIILDDAGYLEINVFVEIIGLWNATEGRCGWMMLGDDSLENKINRGLKSKKVGFKALFSRFSGEFIRLMPMAPHEKSEYLKQLIGDVANANGIEPKKIARFIKLCIGKEKVLRHLDTLIQIDKENA